jgi:hypothetical protein
VPPSTIPHGGNDLNYIGGRYALLNKSHPAIHSPVDGVVTNAGQGTVGKIAIRDKDGFSHEILHTQKQNVSIGDPVAAGQLIGTMGNTGTHDQHVHYQLKDPEGHTINPTTFWDQQGAVEPNPAPPAHATGLFGTGGQFAPGSATSPRSRYDSGSFIPPSDEAAIPDGSKDVRRLVRVSGPTAAALVEMAAKPVTPLNEIPPDRPASFDDRFGDWVSSQQASAPRGPYQVGPPQQGSRPLGIVSGKPMPDYPFPPPIWGPPNNSGSQGDDSEDWYARWLGPARWK